MWVATELSGLPESASRTVYVCCFIRQIWPLPLRTIATAVFSCVASRNKRCVSHSQLAASAPILRHGLSETQFRSVPPGRPSGVLLGFSLPYWPDAARAGLFYPVRVEAAAAKRKFRPSTGRGARPARGQFQAGQSSFPSPARLKGHILWVGTQPTNENCRGRLKKY